MSRTRARWPVLWAENNKNKHKKINGNLMASNYTTRRMVSSATRTTSGATWARNRNAVRHNARVTLGPIWHTITVLMILVLLGFIYLTQSSKVTSFDLSLAETNSEIASLEVQRDALAVENAKITAKASNEDTNEVASTMVDAHSSDFVSAR